jgi:hypothetical protein
MSVRSVFTSNRSMRTDYFLKAARVAGGLRAALGEAASVEFQERRRLLDETIYNRVQVTTPPPKRVLTGRLRRSERIVMAGTVAKLQNTAPYARIRHDMTGRSKLYGHKLDSFWAGRAHQRTVSRRAAIFRRALRIAQRGR